MINPALVISLDFELHWGRFDKYPLESCLGYYRNTKDVIPRLLDLFTKYEIHVTWATVGMLMAESREELEYFSPELKPSYTNRLFSAYTWVDSQKKLFKEALFAPDLVKMIIDTPNQELGSHSFAHYYSLEEGQNHKQWEADLKSANRIAFEKFGHTHYSLVFPRNQYSEKYLKVAESEGFQAVRTNPKDWFWQSVQHEKFLKKVFRTGDTLFPLGLKTSYLVDKPKNGIIPLPASRLLRPFRPNSFFNLKRIDRIKKEIETTIKFGEFYHLWWHPHNFGHYPKENLMKLEELLQWVRQKMEINGIETLSMKEAAEKCKKRALN
ncbi:MAG TPA: polysaccharide deacetylase family protein [Algoriphagus sp.]|nr:polysaccharide deacetylase family protein [Algoriphagus sp.]